MPEGLEADKRGYLLENFRLFHLKDTSTKTLEYHYHEFDKIILLLSGKVTYISSTLGFAAGASEPDSPGDD